MTGNRFAALAEDDESVSAVAAADAAPPRSRKPRRRIASPPRNVREPPIFPEEEPFDDDAGPSQHYMVYSSTTIDPSVTKGMYMEWRWPRRCEENPTDLTNPYYIAMIKCGWSAWSAAKKFTRKQSSLDRAPEWCFSPRFGRSRTVLDRPVASVGGYMLEAGTKLFIAGEHEDYYDDDFCIYNDVTVVRPNGEIRIYGYPTDVFPPTDGHSATVVGDKIWIIGSVGYMWTRGKEAQVCILDLATMRMSRHTTTGDDPGWLAGHVVTRVFEDAIEVEVGQEPCPGTTARSGKWTLYTTDFRWERNTDANVVPERTSMDEASCRGLTAVLDFWKNRGELCVYVGDCIRSRRRPGMVEEQWADLQMGGGSPLAQTDLCQQP